MTANITLAEETVIRMKMESVCFMLRHENYQRFPLKLLKTVNITSKLVKGFYVEGQQNMCEVSGLYKNAVMTLL